MDLFLKQQQKYVCVDTHTEHIIIHTSYTWVEKPEIELANMVYYISLEVTEMQNKTMLLH